MIQFLLSTLLFLITPVKATSINANVLKSSTSFTVSSGTFLANGNTQYSVETSSGIKVKTGGVTAPFFSGVLKGNSDSSSVLDHNPSNCSSGEASAGIDATGAAEGCFVPTNSGHTVSTFTDSTGNYYNFTQRIKLAFNDSYFVLKDSSTNNATIVELKNNYPVWTKYTKTYLDWSTASTSSSTALVTVTSMTIVHAVRIKHTQPFTGGGLSNYYVSIGSSTTSEGWDRYASPFDVFTSTSSGNLQYSTCGFSEDTPDTYTIYARAESVGDNLNNTVQGSVDIWVLTSSVYY